ncbi:MAG: DUF2179 domain-containing protein [Bilophila wadsworthia]
MRQYIAEIDPEAFLIFSDVTEVVGLGFKTGSEAARAHDAPDQRAGRTKAALTPPASATILFSVLKTPSASGPRPKESWYLHKSPL